MSKKAWVVTGIIVIVILVILSGLQSYNLYQNVSKLKGQNELLRIQRADLEIKNQALRNKGEAKVKELKQDIQDLGVDIAKKEVEIAGKNKVLKELETELPALQDKGEIIANLSEQNKLLKENFSLALSEIESLKGQVIKWELAYNAQVEISEAWKKDYLAEKALRENTDLLLKKIEGRLKRSQLNSKLSKVAIGALGGIVIYGLIKK